MSTWLSLLEQQVTYSVATLDVGGTYNVSINGTHDRVIDVWLGSNYVGTLDVDDIDGLTFNHQRLHRKKGDPDTYLYRSGGK